uniref:Solute carrier family 2, facilitated glucose transporter member 12 n=1 Tax=Bubo bubo TaxID=30461 RepID=A0A8C0IEY9_BUBBB
ALLGHGTLVGWTIKFLSSAKMAFLPKGCIVSVNVAEVTLSIFYAFSLISGCGTFTFLSSAVAAISGLLMGYELGLISGALLQMSSILVLSCKEQEIVVSSLLFGALFASLTGGFLIDRFGRRPAIIIASSLLVLGSLILLPYESYRILIVGRIAIGISISLSSIATCVYIAEIAPQHRRGLLVSLNELMIVIGILFAYISNYAFASISHGWKYMFGLVIPLGALQAVAMYFLPPSPRFLVMKNNDEAARKVLEKLRETSDATKELTVIKSSLKDEHQYSFLDLFRSKNNMRARMLVGLTLVFFVQTTGQPNILFYASTVLKSVGAGMTCPAWHLAVPKLSKAVFSANMCWYCSRQSWRAWGVLFLMA